MPVIKVDNFSGGRNTYTDARLLQNNELPFSSYNVWAPLGYITKMPGIKQQASLSSTANTLESIYYDSTITTAYNLYYRIGHLNVTSSNISAFMLFGSLGFSESLTPLGYTTGTVSISGASLISATGSGTTWASHVSAGDNFRVDSTAANWFKISSVEDNTHLTLSSAVPVAVATGSAYTASQTLDFVEIPWESLGGSMWSCTTGNIMQQFNGTGVLRVSAAPKAAYLQTHRNYLFAARASTAESRLYWSTIKDGTSWPVNNFIDIDKDRGKISGLISYGDELIVFKTFGMYKVVGETFDPLNPTYSVVPIMVPDSFRFNSNYTATIHKGTLIFRTYEGLYSYIHGTGFITKISRKFDSTDVPQTFDDLFSSVSTDQRMYSISIDNYLIIKGIKGPQQTSDTLGLGIIDDNNAWWTSDSTQQGSFGGSWFQDRTGMVVFSGTSTKPQLVMFFRANKPRIITYEFDPVAAQTLNFLRADTGATLAIESKYVSKDFSIGYGTFKRLIIYFVKQSVGNLTVDYRIDGLTTTKTIDMTTSRTDSIGIVRKVIDIFQKGTSIRVQFSNLVIGETFKIFGYEIEYEIESDSRVV